MSLKKRLFVAMATGVGGFGLKTVLNLTIIPFIIAYLGASAYGVYVLLTTSVEMLSSLGFGLNRSFTLRLGQALGTDNASEEKTLLRLCFWIYCALIGCLLTLGLISTPFVQSGLQWPDAFRLQVPGLITLVLVESALMILSGYFRATLAAHTRFGIANGVDMTQAILTNLACFGLLWLGYPLIALMGIRCLMAALAMSSLFWISKRQWGVQRNWHPKHITATEFAKFWECAWVSNAQQFCMLLSCRIDSLVIGSALAMPYVAAYGIVQRMFGQAVFLGLRVAEGVFPIMTRLSATNETGKAQAFFLRTSQGLLFLACFLTLWLSMHYVPIFQFLSRGKLDMAVTLPVVALMVPFCITTLMNVPANNYLYSNNFYRLQLRWAALSAAANFLISISLVRPLGLTGVALGTLLPTLWEQQTRMIPTACKQLDIPYTTYLGKVYGGNVMPVMAMAVAAWASAYGLSNSGLGFPWTFLAAGGIIFVAGLSTWIAFNVRPDERLIIVHGIRNRLKIGSPA